MWKWIAQKAALSSQCKATIGIHAVGSVWRLHLLAVLPPLATSHEALSSITLPCLQVQPYPLEPVPLVTDPQQQLEPPAGGGPRNLDASDDYMRNCQQS